MNSRKWINLLYFLTIITLIALSIDTFNESILTKTSRKEKEIIEYLLKNNYKNKILIYLKTDICGVCVLALIEKINKLSAHSKQIFVFIVAEESHKNMLQVHLKTNDYDPQIFIKAVGGINYSFISYYSFKKNHLFYEKINLNTNLNIIAQVDSINNKND